MSQSETATRAPTTADDGRARPRAKTWRRDGRAALLFLGPWFVGLIAITIGSIVASLALSFTDYNLLQARVRVLKRFISRRGPAG